MKPPIYLSFVYLSLFNPSSPTNKHFTTLVNVSKIFSNHVDGICNVRSMYIACNECLCICRRSWSWQYSFWNTKRIHLLVLYWIVHIYIVSDYILLVICGVPHWVATHIKRIVFFQASQVRLEPVFRIVDTRTRQRLECCDHSLSLHHICAYRVLRMRSQWLVVFCI